MSLKPLCIFVGLLFCTFACQEQPKEKPQVNKSIFRTSLDPAPNSLDPRSANDVVSSSVIRMLFDGLTRRAPTGLIVPSIAENIEVSTAMDHYVFTLRETYWTDGLPVTAYDFEASWKRILDPNFPSDNADQLFVIKNAKAAKSGEVPLSEVGVKAKNSKTLIVDLEHSTPYFLELTAHTPYFPINSKVDAQNPEWMQAAGRDFTSNGPFKLTQWKHFDHLVVEKNERYWNHDTVKLDQIEMCVIPDDNTALNLFENNEIDWLGLPLSKAPLDALPSLKATGSLHTHPIAGSFWFFFNVNLAPWNNLKLRKAFSYAVNRQLIVDNITQAKEIPATGIVPPTMRLGRKDFFKDHNIRKARTLFNEALEEMGINKEELPTIILTYNTGEDNDKIIQALQQQWFEAFGIQVQLETMEWKVYLDMLHNHTFQFGRMAWLADFNDPVNFLNIFKYRNGSTNYGQWHNERYTQILNESTETVDPMARTELLAKAETILIQEMPIIPLYHYSIAYLKKAKVKGIYLSPLGGIDFKWAYIEK